MAEYLFKVEFHLTPPGDAPIGETGEPGIRIAPGQIVTDPPAHLVGTCGPDCQMKGEHGWGVKDGLIEVVGGIVDGPATITVGEAAAEEVVIAPKRKRKGEEV